MTPETLAAVRELVDDTDGDGNFDLRLCADVVAYVQGPFRDHADGIAHFYDVAMRQIRGHVRYYLIDGQGRFKKAKADILSALPDWANGTVAERYVYGLDLESGKAPDEQSDRAFHMYVPEEGMGFVRLILPAESLLDPDGFFDLARDGLGKLRFVSAYGGFAVNARRTYNAWMSNSRVAVVSRRFRGIDLGRPLMFASFLDDSIKCVNWLTGVGEPLLARAPELLDAIPPPAQVIRLQHGILIRASETPSVGDTNRREDLSVYASVGQALTPLRISRERLGPYDGIGGSENTQSWLARFDRQ